MADLNGDGHLDLVVANFCGYGCSSYVAALLGNGDGTFQPAVDYYSRDPHPTSVAVADVNGDGKPDLLVGNWDSNTVAVLPGNGDGTFQSADTYALTWPVGSIAVVDLNGDSTPDIVAASGWGGVGVMLHVGDIPTTTAVVSSPNPSTFGRAVTLTATVNSSSGAPTGTVAFFDNSTALGNATLTNGNASILVSGLAVGAHSLAAVYQGSLKFSSSASSRVSQVVNAATTTTSVSPSINPVIITKPVMYTATVTGQYGGTATGTVTFQDGGVTIATTPVGNNQAAYSTSYKTISTHAITATYSGDANNTGSTSATLVEQVQGFPSKTAVSTSGSPSLIGQPVTFTATVTWTHGTIPDGELVTFYDGTTAIGTGTTAAGVTTFTTSSLTAKTHFIKATYAGDATFRTSSGGVTQVVNGYATSTTLTSSLNPSIYGQKVTFTATVKTSGPTAPTGYVNFTWATSIGWAPVNASGVATLSKLNLNVGSYPLTAVYWGDASNARSTSAILNQVVLQASSTAAITSSPNPSTVGQAVTFTAKITSPTVLPTGPVTFTAGTTVLGTAQLSGGKATFTTSSLSAGSTAVTVTYAGNSNIAKSSASVTQVVQP